MAIYLNIPPNEAYRLLNSGALILVSTSDMEENFNLAPIAWHCPVDNEPATKLLFVTDVQHKTYANIRETGKFVVCIPHASQLQLVRDMGSCSGAEVNKLQKFSVEYALSEKYQLPVPTGCIAYIECNKIREIIEDGVAILIGEVINAKAIKGSYRDRLISEKDMGKTLHHLGNDKFVQPGELVE
jgi:flavin reductase (DIM6/NTAB) family NADH-FMN oxidoreductase RutF